jgi:hypothetical protein
MMDFTDNFLQELYKRISELHSEDISTGYNIFSVLEVSEKEVIMCRMLYDLLNPYGHHGEGTRFLETFLTDVLNIPVGRLTEFLDNVEVYKEYQITDPYRNTERRIDIVICNEKHFLPIEVKINAEDQPSQCYIYYEYAQKYDEETVVYYLSSNGKEPSHESLSLDCKQKHDVLDPENVRQISFAEDVAEWLKSAIASETDSGMRLILMQYLHAIEGFCGTTDKGIRKMIVNELLKNKENLSAGIEVGKYIKYAQIELIKKVMGEFRHQMEPLAEKYDLTDLGAESWYAFEQQADSFYKNSYSSFPGINYKVNRAKMTNGRELWFRIEIDWKLFAGFCLFDADKHEQVDNVTGIEDELLNFLDYKRIDCDEWWINWKYLPTGLKESTDDVPEFHNMNEAAIMLADDDILKETVRKSISAIEKEFLVKIK